MTFPTTGILDNFNRANEGPPMTGWTGLNASISGRLQVISNACGSSGSPATDCYNTNFGPDVEVYADYLGVDRIQVAGRITNEGTTTPNYYTLYTNPANTLQVYRVDAGVATQLGADISQTLSAGDSIGMSIIGSTITVYYKASGGSWVALTTRTDSTYSSAGKLGLITVDATGVASIDNFGGGTVGAATLNQPLITTYPARLIGKGPMALRRVARGASKLFNPNLQPLSDTNFEMPVYPSVPSRKAGPMVTRRQVVHYFPQVGAGAQTVIPSTAALTTSAFAPVLKSTIALSTTSLTLTKFAPVLRTAVVPGTKALTLTTFAPTIVNNVTVIPGTRSLTITKFAPAAIVSLIVVPSTKALVLTTFAPTIINNVTVIPGTKSLTLTKFAPVVNRGVVPATKALSLTAFAPKLAASIVPNTATLTITRYAPRLNEAIIPPTRALSLATFAPVFRRAVTPATATFTLTRFAPKTTLGVIPATRALTITKYAPTPVIHVGGPQRPSPDTAHLILTTHAPVSFHWAPSTVSVAREHRTAPVTLENRQPAVDFENRRTKA